MCSVVLGVIEYEASERCGDERCLPACTRRRSDDDVDDDGGRPVRTARRVVSVEIVVVEGTVRGIVLCPETPLTNIWMESSSAELTELRLEELDVRRMFVCVRECARVGVCAGRCGDWWRVTGSRGEPWIWCDMTRDARADEPSDRENETVRNH